MKGWRKGLFWFLTDGAATPTATCSPLSHAVSQQVGLLSNTGNPMS